VTVALLALALALPALALTAWPLVARPREARAAPADAERAGLETEKFVALRALRELELDRQAGQIGEQDYAEARARYEAQAAEVLRRLDALGPPPVSPARPRMPTRGATMPWTRQPAVLGATGAGLLAFGVALGLLVARYTAPAPSSMGPGDAPLEAASPTPGPEAPPASTEGAPPRPLPKEVLEGMLRAAHSSLDAGRYQEAIAAYKAVLRRDPRNVEAITHLGVILAIAGHQAEALDAFDRALAIDPDYAHALWDKAGVLESRGDYPGAVTALEHFVRLVPAGPDHDQAQARIRAARARLAAGPGSAARP
jgi:tetratricopeptide (TPR) repeat protein